MYFHIGVHLLILLFLFQFQHLVAILVIVITHYFIDLAKLYLGTEGNTRFLFVADQFMHIAIIIAVTYSIQAFTIDFSTVFTDKSMLLAAFLIFVSFTSSILVKMIITPWDRKINLDNNSIDGAGKYIGILERLFVFTFVLLGTWSAIGFLITAKSVFRFGDLNEGKKQKTNRICINWNFVKFWFSDSIRVAL